ncbi:FadR/GntR family transcriptional regulator [Gulosibacter sp. ACHW.36C]|uniref:GntR family transcriptional regulator n=1 Tax=Gulosibacter sediminis TaxID=1729695 RepID=A0ABY4MVC4_9MICO|nr:GntR family transcriptional regulator [Gulosibacter sediminis]UQN14334.1 GntR family transcriptional regulator [Gulosibacter sediminis]
MNTASLFSPVRPRLPASLTSGDELADTITAAISLGSIAVGDRLPAEIDLAAEFGVAVATLRKSLAVLRSQQVVETRRGRDGGTFVMRVPFPSDAQVREYLRSLSIIDLRDYSDEHTAVAGGIARLVSQRALDQDLDALAEQAQQQAETDDLTAQVSLDNRFYVQLGAESQSQRLMRAQMRLQSEVSTLKWSPAAAATSSEAAKYARIQVADALRQRDPELAEATIGNLIRQTTYRIIDVKLTLDRPDSEGNAAS